MFSIINFDRVMYRSMLPPYVIFFRITGQYPAGETPGNQREPEEMLYAACTGAVNTYLFTTQTGITTPAAGEAARTVPTPQNFTTQGSELNNTVEPINYNGQAYYYDIYMAGWQDGQAGRTVAEFLASIGNGSQGGGQTQLLTAQQSLASAFANAVVGDSSWSQPSTPPGSGPPPPEFDQSFFGCFIYGTIFRTLKDNTEVPIEIQNLKVGDLVKTEVYVNQKECQFSLDAWQRIKRMIRRPLTADEYANKTRILPKDAFGPGKPDKDLHVTWGHGLLLKEMKEEWKNDEYDGNHVTYSKEHALVKGDFIKLLAGHCSLCRKPNEEENKKADEEREKRAYYHLELEDKAKRSQHALVTHGVTSESLVDC